MPENRLGTFDNGTIQTCYFAAAVTRGTRLVITGVSTSQGAPTATVADATTAGDGVADVDITPIAGVANTYYGQVRRWNNGSCPFVAAGAIALTDKLYAAAGGQVANAAAGGGGLATPIGKPLRSAAAALDIINGIPALI